ncbi:MAG: hypothetical protein GQ564_07615 [Bacteroidales bacterium]|nr:hypothetical protein [Bacteroidales bacterium]
MKRINKESIKISFPNSPFLKSGRPDPFLEYLIKEGFNFKVEEEIPDANYIFLYPNRIDEMLNICKNYKDKILIFITSESVTPDFNLFDYAIGYDQISFGDRYCQFSFQAQVFNYKLEKNITKSSLDEKKKFCNFLYSNPNSHKNRDIFFHQLSKYKKVDSLGQHLKNVSHDVSKRHSNNFFADSVNEKLAYKFSISFENASHNGYNTEKIISSMVANTIPVFWGDKDINRYYNSESFINCHEYDSFDQVIEKIIDLDNDDDKYLEMLSKRWKTPEQIELLENQKSDFLNFLNNIFNQPIQDAQRKPAGTFNDFYTKRIGSASNRIDNYYKKLHHWGYLFKKKFK